MMKRKKIKVAVVGGNGYTGIELIRILAQHPSVEIEIITSRSFSGRLVSDVFNEFENILDLNFTDIDISSLAQCDLVFFATPNGTAMLHAEKLLNAGTKVIDLAADFRIKDRSVWQHWYGLEHACPHLLDLAVYGLPEMNRETIRSASLLANPGCYPTAVQLACLPLLTSTSVNIQQIIADAKSGVSGAGRQASLSNSYCEVSENFSAYKASGHRHLPEIKQGIAQMANVAVSEVGLTFVPHLVPMMRGIHATVYLSLNDASIDLQSSYENYYSEENFVEVIGADKHPHTKSVRGTNHCKIAIHRPVEGNVAVVLSVIDNLGKGAAGQAVQNMNIMFDMPENCGLQQTALVS